MKMSELEKKFVNSIKQAKKNIEIAERLFEQTNLNNVRNVLEVGCGIGFLTSYLAKEYKWNVTGIDLDSEQVKRAKIDNKENDYLRFFEADATDLPFENNEFDVILSFDVLHHIPNWDKALNEISRVLRLNGIYILNDLALPRFTAKTFKDLLNNYMGVYSVDDIVNQLKRNNLDILYMERPTINILMKHFSLVSQICPTE